MDMITSSHICNSLIYMYAVNTLGPLAGRLGKIILCFFDRFQILICRRRNYICHKLYEVYFARNVTVLYQFETAGNIDRLRTAGVEYLMITPV